MFSREIIVQENTRTLIFKDGVLTQILKPGKHKVSDWGVKFQTETYDITSTKIGDARLFTILKSHGDKFSSDLLKVEPSKGMVAVVLKNGKVFDLVPNGNIGFYWKQEQELQVIEFETKDALIKEDLSKLLMVLPIDSLNFSVVNRINIPVSHIGLFFVNNKFHSELTEGIYHFWSFGTNVTYRTIDLRQNELEVTGQEVLSKDKVTLRANVVCYYKVVDPRKAVDSSSDYSEFMHKNLQFALRESFEQKTLDELLESKSSIDKEIYSKIKELMKDFGIEIISINIKDIILPGEMREILNQVLQAEKLAQANLVKRREETAATRSLLNTAKLMDDHPMLLRLKELEALENILQKVDNLSIYGGTEDLIGKVLGSSTSKKN